jgi:hypothetical protein
MGFSIGGFDISSTIQSFANKVETQVTQTVNTAVDTLQQVVSSFDPSKLASSVSQAAGQGTSNLPFVNNLVGKFLGMGLGAAGGAAAGGPLQNLEKMLGDLVSKLTSRNLDPSAAAGATGTTGASGATVTPPSIGNRDIKGELQQIITQLQQLLNPSQPAVTQAQQSVLDGVSDPNIKSLLQQLFTAMNGQSSGTSAAATTAATSAAATAAPATTAAATTSNLPAALQTALNSIQDPATRAALQQFVGGTTTAAATTGTTTAAATAATGTTAATTTGGESINDVLSAGLASNNGELTTDEQTMVNAITDPNQKAMTIAQLKIQHMAETQSFVSNIMKKKDEMAQAVIANLK